MRYMEGIRQLLALPLLCAGAWGLIYLIAAVISGGLR